MIFSFKGGYIDAFRWTSSSLSAKRVSSDTNIYKIPLIHCDALTSFFDVPTNANLNSQIVSINAFISYIAPPTSDNKNGGVGFYYEGVNPYYYIYDKDKNFRSLVANGKRFSSVFVKDDSTGYIYSGYLRDLDGVEVISIINYAGNAIIPYYKDFTVIGEQLPEMVNFYRSSPEGDINVSRGETVNLEFTAVYDDGSTVTPYTDVVYSDLPPESTAVFDGNSFTISENCRASIFTSIAKPNIGETTLYAFVQAKISNPVNPYLPDDGGISGGGAQSGSSDAIGSFDGTPGPSIVGNLPVGSSGSDIASSGMYTKYLCNNALLNTLAQFFWEDNLGIQALKAVFGNPIDSIISLACYPFALETLVPNTSTTIYFGKYNTTWPAFSLTKSSFQIDWGTVNIPFFWGSFLDYAPYTKIQLYLPWGVGFVSLDPNEVMPWSSKNSFNQTDFTTGSVRVITNIELDKGSCVHNVIGNNDRIIGSFGGIVGKQIPVVGTDDSARTLALIGSAMMIGTAVGGAAASFGGATAGGAVAGGFLGTTSAIASGAVESIPTSTLLASTSALAKTSPTYPRAGTFSDATNTLGYQYPYLIISRPSQSVPQQYGRFMGYPSNIFHNHLGEVRGYTEVSNIHLDDIPATSVELDELKSILKGGVLL